jgi:hypothetical protein
LLRNTFYSETEGEEEEYLLLNTPSFILFHMEGEGAGNKIIGEPLRLKSGTGSGTATGGLGGPPGEF